MADMTISKKNPVIWFQIKNLHPDYIREVINKNKIHKYSPELLLFTGNIPRGVFCEQSSQKTRELRREIMQSMISVHREACYCERSEQ